MKKIINEKTVADLRADIINLGYFEKSGELSSGGGLQSDFVDILSYLLKEWKKQNGESCKLTFTAGNDVFHKKGKSRHANGEAVDVVLGTECHSNFIQILKRYKSIYPGFAYIDEYTYPSKGATGGHFHISYRQGQPEGGKNNKEDGDDEVEVKPPTKSDSSGASVTTTTTTEGIKYDVYGGLLNTLDPKDNKSGQSTLMNAGKAIWAQTGGKIQNALGVTTEHNSNNLNEEVRRIKKMMNL